MDSNPYHETSNFVDLLTSQQGCVPPQPFRYDGFSHGGEVGSSQVPPQQGCVPPQPFRYDGFSHGGEDFVDLLTSQQGCVPPQPFRYDGFSHGGEVGSSQVPPQQGCVPPHCTDTASIGEETPSERRERKKWTLTEDVVLISAWLNTSKDPVVQGGEKRESIQCKQRWQKINDLVSKFSGSYEAATRQKTSGMNENDVVKLAHEIFHNDHKMKFNLQHAWEELRFDQKWCEVASSKLDGSCKKRKCDDGAQSSSSYATTNDAEQRPPGVKASKRGSGKRTNEDLKDISEIKSLWAIKEKDLEVKERLSRMGLLETLIAKTEQLSEFEEALKSKLISEIFLIVTLALYQAAQSSSHCCSVSGGNRLLYQGWSIGSGLLVLCVTGVEHWNYLIVVFLCHSVIVGLLCHGTSYWFNLSSVSMASSSHNDSDNFDQAFDQYFDERFDQTFENLVVAYSGQQEERPERKKRVYIERNREAGHIRLWNDYFSETPTPTPADLQRLLDIGEQRGFPGMIGSIDCMHWEWKNCPTAWKGQYSRGSGTLNDINVLDRSPVFDDIINGQAPQVTYSVNGKEYHLAYYLTDGIYPKWTTFIQSIQIPQGPKAVLFAQRQEAARKDVERAFGVLQARFAIVKNPTLFWDKVKIGNIMRACIILHNMIVEDERDGYTQFNVSEFQQGEDAGSSHVDLTYSTDMPSNIVNMMGVRTRIRDKQMHQRLKADLVEHIWRKFGRDEDNN
uniref:Myb-like domain-containing protein n=1 Tax=Brassica oleracea var. oleracea TaxID=109376 RepID=A0A0D3DZB6_BRAOL